MVFTNRLPKIPALVMGGVLFTAADLHGQATDLILSEYVEGSGNNKFLELYNGTGAAVSLSDYQLQLFTNGAATATATATLSGTLADGTAIVYGNTGGSLFAASGALPLNAICNFNGDDAVALRKISTASYVDIFGNIGCDPGTAWTGGGNTTVDRTLRRNSNVCGGVTTNPGGSCPFPTLATEWTQYGQDVVSGLGSHTQVCAPVVTFASPTGSALENVGAPQTITLNIAPPFSGTGTITLNVVNGPGAVYGTDYITDPAVATGTITLPVNGTNVNTVTFELEPLDDAITEGDETVTFTITAVSAGLQIGGADQHVFTIIDDDVVPTVNFATASMTVLESNAGPHTFQLTFSHPAVGPGIIQIQVTDGPGAVYGVDHTTNPAPAAGVISVPFANNALTAGFTITVLNDGIPEDTETITFTIVNVPAGNAIGAQNVRTFTIGDDDHPPTVLEPGDLLILGVNASNHTCSGYTPNFDDLVSFMCFAPITPGTELIITDNGYQRCNPGQWGNTEGTVRITRTGVAIPAGQVITLRIVQEAGAGNVVGLAPDAGWTCTNLNTPAGMGIPNPVALNANGDQLFFMQGGTWSSGTNGGNDATYDGNVLFGFSTNPAFPWSAACNSSQRSDLPPGVECFSMAPTAATDFAKYRGTLTAATQRDWIIRVDNQANWNTYTNCTDYGIQDHDWLAAPILPIIPGTYTHGLWRGSVSQDWFDCKNWDDARVPDASTHVEVNNDHSTNHCVIGLNGTDHAECASLLVHAGSGTPRHLIVENASTLTVHGPLTVLRTVSTSALLVTAAADSRIHAAAATVQGSTGPNSAILRAQEVGSEIHIAGDLDILSNGLLDLNQTPGIGGTLFLGGNWNNTMGDGGFDHPNSTVRFVGSGDQEVHMVGGSGHELFNNLVIDKPAGDVVLHVPIEIIGTLDLTSGRIMNNAGEEVTLRNSATVVNASHASFVHGSVQKEGSADFTFPVGKGHVYRPCTLSDIDGASSVAFRAEYFNESPRTTFNDMLEQPPLHHISDCEYWTIERAVYSPNARVTLSWHDPTSCIVDDLATLRVARWDGTLWRDRGNGGTTGDFFDGTISTAAVQTEFGPWTLASLTEANPLPVELLHFDAEPHGAVVNLTWSTASERDNDHFTVERSADGIFFTDLLQVPGVVQSSHLRHYAEVDRQPLPGLSYYRLRQTDRDGTATWSRTVAVHRPGARTLAVHVGSELLTVFHDLPVGTAYELRDMTGRLVLYDTVAIEGPLFLPAHQLPAGPYVLRMVHPAGVESVRFVR